MDRLARGKKLDNLILKMATGTQEPEPVMPNLLSIDDEIQESHPSSIQVLSNGKGGIIVRNSDSPPMRSNEETNPGSYQSADNREARRSLLDTYLYPSSEEEDDVNSNDILPPTMEFEPQKPLRRSDPFPEQQDQNDDGERKIVCKYHNGRWTCSECGSSYNFPSSFYRHRRRAHPSIKKQQSSSTDQFAQQNNGHITQARIKEEHLSTNHILQDRNIDRDYRSNGDRHSMSNMSAFRKEDILTAAEARQVDQLLRKDNQKVNGNIKEHHYPNGAMSVTFNCNNKPTPMSPKRTIHVPQQPEERKVKVQQYDNGAMAVTFDYEEVGQKRCPLCGRYFSCVSSRNRHMRDIHNSDKDDIKGSKLIKNGPYSPEDQTVPLSNDKSVPLRRLQRYSCPHCDIVLDSDEKLIDHLKCHSVEESFVSYSCSWCGLQTSNVGALEAHEKEAHKILYNCGSCNKSFSCRSEMIGHLINLHKLLNIDAMIAVQDAQEAYHMNSGNSPLSQDCIPIVNVCIDDDQVMQEQQPHEDFRQRYPVMQDPQSDVYSSNNQVYKEENVSPRHQENEYNSMPHLITDNIYRHSSDFNEFGRSKLSPPLVKVNRPVSEDQFPVNNAKYIPKSVEKPITRSIAYDGKILYECNQCDRKFKRKFYFDYHLEQHREAKSKVLSGLSVPVSSPSMSSSPSKNICPICDATFSNLQQLEKHCQVHFNDEQEQFTCTVCSKSFSSMANLRRHVRLAHELQPSDSRISKIMYEPTKNNAAICRHCNKQFSNAANLKRHNSMVHKVVVY